MKKLLLLSLLIFAISPLCVGETYLQCSQEDLQVVGEITSSAKGHCLLVSVYRDGVLLEDARVFLNDVELQYGVPVDLDLRKYHPHRQERIAMLLPVYYAYARTFDLNEIRVVIEEGRNVHRFDEVDIHEGDSAQGSEPFSISRVEEPLSLEFIDIRYEIAGGIKVIHIKIYNTFQIIDRGMVRVRFKRKTLNPLQLFGMGTLDLSGHYSVYYYKSSFKFGKEFEFVTETDPFSLVLAVHTGIRYRFGNYATTKSRRILVDKAGVGISNLQLHIDYEIGNEKKSYTVDVGNFDRSIVYDLNPHYGAVLLERIPRQNLFPSRDEKEIIITNTSGQNVANLHLSVSYSAGGKSNLKKEIAFAKSGDEYVELDVPGDK